jgi:hypothetical protein
MKLFDTMHEKWNNFHDKTQPFWNGLGKFGNVLKIIGRYIVKLWPVIISVPVAVAAIILAIQNAGRLPDPVGVNLLSSGDFGLLMPKLVVVLVPLLLTGICIVMTIFSKRTLFPWLVSVFTLVLPILIWITNMYPV